jgi:hypothetical protein
MLSRHETTSSPSHAGADMHEILKRAPENKLDRCGSCSLNYETVVLTSSLLLN